MIILHRLPEMRRLAMLFLAVVSATSLPGNRMSFPGIKDDAVLADLLSRLKQATQ
jgi:cytochrome c2